MPSGVAIRRQRKRKTKARENNLGWRSRRNAKAGKKAKTEKGVLPGGVVAERKRIERQRTRKATVLGGVAAKQKRKKDKGRGKQPCRARSLQNESDKKDKGRGKLLCPVELALPPKQR